MHAAEFTPSIYVGSDFDLPVFRDDFLAELSKPVALPQRAQNTQALKSAHRLYSHFKKYSFTRTQVAFVRAYVECDLDATRAAVMVNLSVDHARAGQLARELLRRDYVALAVKLLLDYHVQANKFVFNRDKYLRRLDRMAEQNLGDYAKVFPDGSAEPSLPNPATERERYDSIKKIKFRTTSTGRGAEKETTHETELELYDPAKAIEMLFKYCEEAPNARAAKVAEVADDFTNWQPTTFEIVEVEPGSFIPAPEPPTIEHIAAPG